ncbi:hypothetical protein Y023_5883 [Burkholderia pseudomallei A79D]|nr:hypothetical protein Y023_5883 [Burkholderia pseudomallei A79D]KGX94788.1 hypothetical protein X997_5733 [Burkholderia pseudomallei A79C]
MHNAQPAARSPQPAARSPQPAARNAQRTTHNAQRTTHNAQRTTHNLPPPFVFAAYLCPRRFAIYRSSRASNAPRRAVHAADRQPPTPPAQ